MRSGKKVKIFTFGCQMNVYDSQHMLHQLAQAGYEETDDAKEAAVVILNTCSVREKPVMKLHSALGRLRRLKSRNRKLLLIVAGCVAQQEQQALAQQVPFLDIVMGPDHVTDIVQLIEQALRSGEQIVATSFEESQEKLFATTALRPSDRVSAYVTVMKGCNQFCSYCIVPHTRGREVSRDVDGIVTEVRSLLDSGVREIFLLGQNVNRYGLDNRSCPPFHELLAMLHDLEGLKRLRFITSHPADCTDELIGCFKTLPKLPPYFHLPLQSGSDRILKLMNRSYSFAHYLERARQLCALHPLFHLSTDLIVGFPGETDEDFEATMQAAREIKWGSAFSFKYSPRPGTGAARMADDVPEAVKKARLEKLQNLLYDNMRLAIGRHIGHAVDVLVEGESAWGTSRAGYVQLTGRTPTNFIVNFDVRGKSSDWKGRLTRVRIASAKAHSLVGEPVEGEE
jgi:tRNA-2-methylthio-N6-dimethylallyladenosine synthase